MCFARCCKRFGQLLACGLCGDSDATEAGDWDSEGYSLSQSQSQASQIQGSSRPSFSSISIPSDFSSIDSEPVRKVIYTPLAGPGSIPLPLPIIFHLRPPTPPPPSGPPPNRPLPPLPHDAVRRSTPRRQISRVTGHRNLHAQFSSREAPSTSDKMEARQNQLLSNVKSSDLSLHAQVHPLIIIEISDHIARHTQRNQSGPIVGGIMGQQNGREIILEHAFEAYTTVGENGGLIIPGDFLAQRVEQLKLVHKDRNLDLVGWYTLMPLSGPQVHILPIHHQILSFNESAVVLGFHTSMLVDQPKDTPGGKIPITIYESNYEVDDANKESTGNDEDKEMKDGDAALKLKFREIPFTPDTFEAEMISLNFVAGGAGNAASAEVKNKKPAAAEVDVKGKRRAAPQDGEAVPTPDTVVLSKEDEEAVAALIGKQNAARMMKSRVDVTTGYLQQLPALVLSGDEVTAASSTAATDGSALSFTALREVQSMTDRLNLVEPSNTERFNKELISEANDVRSIAMLDEMAGNVSEVRDVGKKQNVVEAAKNQGRRMAPDYPSGGGGSGYNLPGAGDLL